MKSNINQTFLSKKERENKNSSIVVIYLIIFKVMDGRRAKN